MEHKFWAAVATAKSHSGFKTVFELGFTRTSTVIKMVDDQSGSLSGGELRERQGGSEHFTNVGYRKHG
jgi:hypothetical protein